MDDYGAFARDYFSEVLSAMRSMDMDVINGAMNAIMAAYEADANVFIMGNGGSASTASHMTCDFNKGIFDRLGHRSRFVCLNDSIPTLMAIANDVSYDDVFSMQLKERLSGGDVVVALSTSGNSKNVLKAAEYAKSRGNIVIGLTGFDGGRLSELSDYNINVDAGDVQKAEDGHMMILHMMFQAFADKFGIEM